LYPLAFETGDHSAYAPSEYPLLAVKTTLLSAANAAIDVPREVKMPDDAGRVPVTAVTDITAEAAIEAMRFFIAEFFISIPPKK
jgi:hypothetical protein